ncbi:MAG TPA: response regulator [Cytophagaceae bacterium]
MPEFNTVLLVDDDYVNNFVTEKLLRKSNLAKEIKSVRNGEEALTYLSELINDIPDLILLDINMPEMDGINFLKNFKKMILDRPVRVILLTASVDPSRKEKLHQLGFADIMIKPFTEEKLFAILNRPKEAR